MKYVKTYEQLANFIQGKDYNHYIVTKDEKCILLHYVMEAGVMYGAWCLLEIDDIVMGNIWTDTYKFEDHDAAEFETEGGFFNNNGELSTLLVIDKSIIPSTEMSSQFIEHSAPYYVESTQEYLEGELMEDRLDATVKSMQKYTWDDLKIVRYQYGMAKIDKGDVFKDSFDL